MPLSVRLSACNQSLPVHLLLQFLFLFGRKFSYDVKMCILLRILDWTFSSRGEPYKLIIHKRVDGLSPCLGEQTMLLLTLPTIISVDLACSPLTTYVIGTLSICKVRPFYMVECSKPCSKSCSSQSL